MPAKTMDGQSVYRKISQSANPFVQPEVPEQKAMQANAISAAFGGTPPASSGYGMTLNAPAQKVDWSGGGGVYGGAPSGMAPPSGLSASGAGVGVGNSVAGRGPMGNFDSYTKDYLRRGNPNSPYAGTVGGPGGGWKGAAGGAASGAAMGSAFGPIGTGIGAAGGALWGLRGGKGSAPTAGTDFAVEDAYAIINSAYKDILGRDANPIEIANMLRGQGLRPGSRFVGEDSLRYIIGQLQSSPEAQVRMQAVNGALAPATPSTPVAPPTPGAPTATGGLQTLGAAGSPVTQQDPNDPNNPRFVGDVNTPPGAYQDWLSRLPPMGENTVERSLAPGGLTSVGGLSTASVKPRIVPDITTDPGAGSPVVPPTDTTQPTVPIIPDPTTTVDEEPPSKTDKPPAITPSPTDTFGQRGGVMEGWDETKWNDPNSQSVKYVAGRILSRYPPTPAGLQQAWQEIKAAFPNASFDGDDAIDFGDGYGPIDVLVGAKVGGIRWAWQPGARGGGATSGGGGAHGMTANSTTAPDSMKGYTGIESPGGQNYSQMILEYLMRQLAVDGALKG